MSHKLDQPALVGENDYGWDSNPCNNQKHAQVSKLRHFRVMNIYWLLKAFMLQLKICVFWREPDKELDDVWSEQVKN